MPQNKSRIADFLVFAQHSHRLKTQVHPAEEVEAENYSELLLIDSVDDAK